MNTRGLGVAAISLGPPIGVLREMHYEQEDFGQSITDKDLYVFFFGQLKVC